MGKIPCGSHRSWKSWDLRFRALAREIATCHSSLGGSWRRVWRAARPCRSNAAAERAVRGIAIGRGNWTFTGSDAGGHGAVAVHTPIETCELNDVDPTAWLAHVFAKLRDRPAKLRDEWPPWNWTARQQKSRKRLEPQRRRASENTRGAAAEWIPICRPVGPASADWIGVIPAKAPAPLPDRLARHDNPRFSQKIFDIAKARRELTIQPLGVAGDFGWKAETRIAEG
ncbi:MAG: transposase domain-containing protein [Pseudomonadota bacterium]|nr:transposase domain-containing protein [Pseudomonadota bacterium]